MGDTGRGWCPRSQEERGVKVGSRFGAEPGTGSGCVGVEMPAGCSGSSVGGG